MSSKAYYEAYRKAHREERKAYSKAYRAAHKEQVSAYNRAYYYRDYYGLTSEDLDVLLASQGGVCAICDNTLEGRWHVDHDHRCCPCTKSCGRCVRGLLCNNCNIMLGHAKDSPAILGAAITYLTREDS